MFSVLKEIIHEIYSHKGQLFEIAVAKQQKNYKGSDLGVFWAFLKPGMYIIAFYVAICIGFKSSKDVADINCPYFFWLTVGLIAWFYMRDLIIGGATCFYRNRLLVLKLGFPIVAVPAIPAISSLLIHGVLMIGVFILGAVMGVKPDIHFIQLPIYTVLMVLFATIWAFFAGCLSVISKDFLNLLKSVSTMIFWLSGVLFDPNTKGTGAITWFFRFNPVTFISEGYKNSLCKAIWIWEKPIDLACYLSVMLVMLILALTLFKRIRREIPDII